MANAEFPIRPFPVRNASQAEYLALNRHNNRIRLERLPDDPPVPAEETANNLQSLPAFVDVKMWAAWTLDGGELVAQGNVALLRVEDNRHMTQIDITVLPEYRRQGLARRLLDRLVQASQDDGRRLLLAETTDRIPAGGIFMNRLGADKGLEVHTNQLRMQDLRRDLLTAWLSHGRELAGEFELGVWEGPYPEDQLQAIAELSELANQQPLGSLEIEDMHITPEQLRQAEQNLAARGDQRWTFYAIERSNRKFAGYTETVWNVHRPAILRQDMTGVYPQYRGRGLGRWLKAAMLEHILKERPEVKFVRTTNADSNAAMLKINQELGFQPYMANTLWQVEVRKVDEYLHTSAG